MPSKYSCKLSFCALSCRKTGFHPSCRSPRACFSGSCASAAAAADGDFDFLGRAVELATGFHDRDHIAGFCHLQAIGHARHGPGRNFIGRRQCVRIFAHQKRDRGHLSERRTDRDRHHRAVLGDFRRVELDLVGWLCGLAIEQLDRVRFALRFERVFRIFVVGCGEGRRQAERNIAEADQRDRNRALQDQAPRGRKAVVRGGHLVKSPEGRARHHSVWRKSTTALISCSVNMRFRPNGGITVCGLRLVSSKRMATRSLRSGYLLLISFSAGPMVPGKSPPLISWQVRQLPLPRSKASFCPSAAADWALAELTGAAALISNVNASACNRAGFLEGVLVKGASRRVYVDNPVENIGGHKHKRHRLKTSAAGSRKQC